MWGTDLLGAPANRTFAARSSDIVVNRMITETEVLLTWRIACRGFLEKSGCMNFWRTSKKQRRKSIYGHLLFPVATGKGSTYETHVTGIYVFVTYITKIKSTLYRLLLKIFSFSTWNNADQIKPLIQRTPTGKLSTVACFKTLNTYDVYELWLT